MQPVYVGVGEEPVLNATSVCGGGGGRSQCSMQPVYVGVEGEEPVLRPITSTSPKGTLP